MQLCEKPSGALRDEDRDFLLDYISGRLSDHPRNDAVEAALQRHTGKSIAENTEDRTATERVQELVTGLKELKLSPDQNSYVGRKDMTPEQAWLMIAARKANKPDFDGAVVFDSPKQFREFMATASNRLDNIEGKQINFVVAGNHWLSGKLQLPTKTSEAKLALMDPMGILEKRNDANQVVQYALLEASSSVIKSVQAYFPAARIYFTDQPRQFSASGCQVFALNSVFKFRATEPFEDDLHVITPDVMHSDINAHGPLNFIRIGPHIKSLTLAQGRKFGNPEYLKAVMKFNVEEGDRRLAQIRKNVTEVGGKSMNQGVLNTLPKYAADSVNLAEKNAPRKIIEKIEEASGAALIRHLRTLPPGSTVKK